MNFELGVYSFTHGRAACQRNVDGGRSARTKTSPTSRSSPSIATAVCDPLCGSIPIMNTLSSSLRSGSPRRALLMRGCRSYFEPRHSTGTGGQTHRSEANPKAAGHS